MERNGLSRVERWKIMVGRIMPPLNPQWLAFRIRFKGCEPSPIFTGVGEFISFPWQLALPQLGRILSPLLSVTFTASSGDLLRFPLSDFQFMLTLVSYVRNFQRLQHNTQLQSISTACLLSTQGRPVRCADSSCPQVAHI